MMQPNSSPEPLTAPHLPARHGFFTRPGGVSGGPVREPELHPLRPGRARAVRKTARAPRRARPAARLLGLTQVHGADVVVATELAPEDRPARRRAGHRPPRPRARHHHRRLRPGPVRRPGGRGDRRGACRLARRGDGCAGGDRRGDGRARRRARPHRSPRSAPASARRRYEVAAGSARRGALARDAADAPASSRPGARRTAGNSISAGYCAQPPAGRRPAYGSNASRRTRWRTKQRFFSHRRRTLAGGGPIGHQISIIGLAG